MKFRIHSSTQGTLGTVVSFRSMVITEHSSLRQHKPRRSISAVNQETNPMGSLNLKVNLLNRSNSVVHVLLSVNEVTIARKPPDTSSVLLLDDSGHMARVPSPYWTTAESLIVARDLSASESSVFFCSSLILGATRAFSDALLK